MKRSILKRGVNQLLKKHRKKDMGPENEALKMNSRSNVLQKGIKVYLRFCNVKRD